LSVEGVHRYSNRHDIVTFEYCIVRWRDLRCRPTAPRNQTHSFPQIQRKQPAAIPSVPPTQTWRRLDNKVHISLSRFKHPAAHGYFSDA